MPQNENNISQKVKKFYYSIRISVRDNTKLHSNDRIILYFYLKHYWNALFLVSFRAIDNRQIQLSIAALDIHSKCLLKTYSLDLQTVKSLREWIRSVTEKAIVKSRSQTKTQKMSSDVRNFDLIRVFSQICYAIQSFVMQITRDSCALTVLTCALSCDTFTEQMDSIYKSKTTSTYIKRIVCRSLLQFFGRYSD